MKVMEAIAQLQHVKPNQYGDAALCGWLSELDGFLYHELLRWHEGAPGGPPGPYDPVNGMGEELLVPEPYAGLYIKYLSAQVDYHNAEYGRYNNSMMMYNTALSAYADWVNRTCPPVQAACVRM